MILEAISATYDGKVLRCDTPPQLPPNTRVIIRIEILEEQPKRKRSFLRTARSLNLDGPGDWSARLEYYLYHHQVESNG